MDLPNRPTKTWEDIRNSVLVKGAIEWVQQDEVPPIPPDLDAHTDVLPGVRVHHRSWASANSIAVWEPGNADVYFVTRYGVIEDLLESKDKIPQDINTILLLAGGTVVAKFLWDILQSFAGTDAGHAKSKERPQPEDRQYNIFISHAWDYDEEYERVVDFLDAFEELEWQNHSVPVSDPLDTVNDVHLQSRLRDQIRTTSVVLVLGGMYSAHREWIQNEIELAKEFDKPIVGIRPNGAEQTPNAVEDAVVEMVGWRQKSIVSAIVEHSD